MYTHGFKLWVKYIVSALSWISDICLRAHGNNVWYVKFKQNRTLWIYLGGYCEHTSLFCFTNKMQTAWLSNLHDKRQVPLPLLIIAFSSLGNLLCTPGWVGCILYCHGIAKPMDNSSIVISYDYLHLSLFSPLWYDKKRLILFNIFLLVFADAWYFPDQICFLFPGHMVPKGLRGKHSLRHAPRPGGCRLHAEFHGHPVPRLRDLLTGVFLRITGDHLSGDWDRIAGFSGWLPGFWDRVTGLRQRKFPR